MVNVYKFIADLNRQTLKKPAINVRVSDKVI
jgi:hypothetical protein